MKRYLTKLELLLLSNQLGYKPAEGYQMKERHKMYFSLCDKVMVLSEDRETYVELKFDMRGNITETTVIK